MRVCCCWKSVVGLFVGVVGLALLPFGSWQTALADPDPGVPEGRWSVQLLGGTPSAGVTHGILHGGAEDPEDDARGRTFSIGASYSLYRAEREVLGIDVDPEIAVQGSLVAVDERSRSPFLNPRVAFAVHWNDFPWSDIVPTTVAIGGGLSWSAQIYGVDRQKHPDEHRSHLKFYWPIEIAVTLPRFPRQQLVFFSHHQSGGTIFDEGGFETYGVGFRYRFE